MKKILAIASACAVSAAAFAQGTIQWTAPGSAFIGRTNSTVYSGFVSSSGTPTGGATGSTAAGQTTLYYYELLTSSTLTTAPTTLSQFAGTLATAWLDTGLSMTNGTAANGRISPVGGAQNAAVTENWALSATQNAIIVGWSADLGSTWATALANLNNWAVFSATLDGANAFFGVDPNVAMGVTLTAANPGGIVIGPGLIDGSTATGSPLQMDLLGVAVPEPGTMALAALGGASLLLFRRKKS